MSVVISTATAAAPATEVVTLSLTIAPVEKGQLADRLMSILETFGGWQDECSTRLFKWSVNVLKQGSTTATEEEFHNVVANKLPNLFKKILINPLYPLLSLKKPMLDRDKWIWEDGDLQKHLQITLFSPYDNGNIQAKTHDFAIAVIDWVKLTPTKIWASFVEADKKEDHALITEADAKASSAIPEKEKMNVVLTTMVLAQQAVVAMRAREKRKTSKAMLAAMKEYEQRLNDQNCARQEATKKIVADTVRNVKEQISLLEQTTKSTVQVLEGRVNAVTASLNQAQAMNQTLQATAANQAEEIRQLRHMYNQQTQYAAGLQHQVNRNKKYTLKI